MTAGGAKKMGTLLRYGTEQWFHVVRRYGPAVSWSKEAADDGREWRPSIYMSFGSNQNGKCNFFLNRLHGVLNIVKK